jgi:M6 family metalloprotease-like protein
MSQAFKGQRFVFRQPDDSEIEVVGWGNQFEAVFETIDGYTVVVNPATGFYEYATLSADGTTLLPSGTVVTAQSTFAGNPAHVRTTRDASRLRARAAHDSDGTVRRWEQRLQQRNTRIAASDARRSPAPAPAPPSGSVTGLCLLIRFPDVAETITRQQIDDFCNQPGYTGFSNNGSVYDYFVHASDGMLHYRNLVTAYYTAANNRAHYTDPTIPFGQRARELIVEALTSLTNAGFDFSSLTVDSGGYVYALNVFYAGPRVNNWSQGLWPHAWGLATPYGVGSGRRLNDYQITDIGSQLSLGTFCHENGHMVCDFPDLYDYGGESNGIGNYCLMCFGGSNTNPVHVSAYLKNQAGWATKLTTMAPGMAYPVAAGANDFLIHNKSATEYFIIENRQKSGRDAALPDAGIAIWHVDENGNNSNEQMTAAQHYECSLEQADNRFDMEKRVNSGDADDLFGTPAKTTFGASTAPSSTWWDGAQSGLEITNVTAPAGVATVSTQAVWQNNLSVVRTHAKNGAQNAWAIVGNSPWLSVRPLSSDGVTNIFLILCEALANGRKVDVLIQGGQITEATLT